MLLKYLVLFDCFCHAQLIISTTATRFYYCVWINGFLVFTWCVGTLPKDEVMQPLSNVILYHWSTGFTDNIPWRMNRACSTVIWRHLKIVCVGNTLMYRQTPNISGTKSQKLNASRLVLHLSLPNLRVVPCYVPAQVEVHWCRVFDQCTTPRASDLHNARASILTPFIIVWRLCDCPSFRQIVALHLVCRAMATLPSICHLNIIHSSVYENII